MSDEQIQQTLAQQATASISSPAELQRGGAAATAAQRANADLVGAMGGDLQALRDNTTATEKPSTSIETATKPPTQGTAAAAPTGSAATVSDAADRSSGGFLSGLLGMGAVGGLVAALGFRRTAGPIGVVSETPYPARRRASRLRPAVAGDLRDTK